MLVLATVGAVSLSLVACGGSSDDSAGTSPAGSSGASAAGGAGAAGTAGTGGAGAAGSAGKGGAGAGGAGAAGAGAGGAGAGGAGAGGSAAAGKGGAGGGAGGASAGSAGAAAGKGGAAGAAGGAAGTAGTGGTGGASAGSGGAAGTSGGAGGAPTGTITPITPVEASGATSLVYSTGTADGWKLSAFDIDGKASTTASTDHCALVTGTKPADVMEDGPGGVDNSFGKNIAPIFEGLDASFSQTTNEAITGGGDTMAFVGLAPSGDPSSFPIALFLANGANVTNPVAWKANASDVSSVSPLIAGATFPMATKTGAAFSSGVSGDVVRLPVVLGGRVMYLPVRGARMTLAYGADGTTKGALGGWIETPALVAEIKKVAGTISTGLCSGGALEGITSQLEQASDILADGTQAPEQTCNAITIGVGIATKPGTVDGVLTPPPAVDPCAD